MWTPDWKSPERLSVMLTLLVIYNMNPYVGHNNFTINEVERGPLGYGEYKLDFILNVTHNYIPAILFA